jgi:N-acetyl-gamma-glutamyl-phosphate reductase
MHPEARLSAAVELEAGQGVGQVMPAFGKTTDVVLETFDVEQLAKKCDVVFMALHGGIAMDLVPPLREAGVKVIDMGPDFRLKNTSQYKKYYGIEHRVPEYLDEAIYGLAPYYREQIAGTSLVAVPGCYVMSVLFPVRPLVDGISRDFPVIVDAISGVSGAGRSLHEIFHFPEMNENVRAYKLGMHQHTPEIEQELGGEVMVQFTPHVGPYTRGILSTITMRPKDGLDVAKCYERYANEPFLRVLGEGKLAEVRFVRGSNFCDFGWVMDKRTGNLMVVSAIDNLFGGTAGMAVQCMNIMFGLEETSGLNFGGSAP